MKRLLSSLLLLMCTFLFFSGLSFKYVSAATAASAANANAMLKTISTNAKAGKVTNSSFAVKSNTIDDVIGAWGKPDSSNYVAAAKGTYAAYDKKNVVYGYNKGSQIFEVRNMDSAALKAITLNDIRRYFGKPQYDSKDSAGRRIVGYKVSNDYKLEFVLQNSSNTAQVHHYNVFYPAGTVNSMASDPGRQW